MSLISVVCRVCAHSFVYMLHRNLMYHRCANNEMISFLVFVFALHFLPGCLIDTMSSQKSASVCKFFLQGRCNKGAQCRFQHPSSAVSKTQSQSASTSSVLPNDARLICSHFLQGQCRLADRCTKYHSRATKKDVDALLSCLPSSCHDHKLIIQLLYDVIPSLPS